jgi:uncharacterized protein YcfJ
MPSIKKAVARKAVKSTAKHSARGTLAKLKRSPVQAATLLGIGSAVGAVAGWMLGRDRGSSSSSPSPS